jgi:hypothetical protein
MPAVRNAVAILAIILLAAVVNVISIFIVPWLNGMVVVPVPGNVTPIVGSSFVAAFIWLAAVVYAVVVLIVTGFHVMLIVPVTRNIALTHHRPLVIIFIRLAAVVYAIVVLVVTGFHVMLIVPVAGNIARPFAWTAGRVAFACPVGGLVAVVSIGGLFTGPTVIWRAARRIIIDRLVDVIARLTVTTTRAIVRWVVRRLLWRIGSRRRLSIIGRHFDRCRIRHRLPMVVAWHQSFDCARQFI